LQPEASPKCAGAVRHEDDRSGGGAVDLNGTTGPDPKFNARVAADDGSRADG
jgi:hypothetical protein